MKKQKVILFGGTFDPIHLGHITVAAHACESLGADKLIVIPAKRSPLKSFFPIASAQDRMHMITLAVSEKPMFQVDGFELDKPAPSYTVDTIRYFKSRFGAQVEIYWLIGADGVDDLQYWHKITDLLDECALCTMYRAGCARPDFSGFKDEWGLQRVKKLQQNVISTPLVDISSTEIRKRLASGQCVERMLAPAVLAYIRRHTLYADQMSFRQDER